MKSKKKYCFFRYDGIRKDLDWIFGFKKLGIDFFDTDQIIENELGMKISKIFKDKGEKFFRNEEEKTTIEILKKREIVISLGGGAFLK